MKTNNSILVTAPEIAKDLGISTTSAYKLIHKWNAELEAKKGKVQFEVEVVAPDKSVHEVKVDATTGKVLSSKLDEEDDDRD